jgi:hypothetical protein
MYGRHNYILPNMNVKLLVWNLWNDIVCSCKQSGMHFNSLLRLPYRQVQQNRQVWRLGCRLILVLWKVRNGEVYIQDVFQLHDICIRWPGMLKASIFLLFIFYIYVWKMQVQVRQANFLFGKIGRWKNRPLRQTHAARYSTAWITVGFPLSNETTSTRLGLPYASDCSVQKRKLACRTLYIFVWYQCEGLTAMSKA